jgi:Uma2 family endonuclease
MSTISLLIPPRINVFSDDELYAFCRLNEQVRIERDEVGMIQIGTVSYLVDSFLTGDFLAEVSLWNRQSRAGRVSDSNGGYTLPDSSMRAPDVGWVSKERLLQVVPEELKRFARVCPDFVIEVRSESDNLKELQAKMDKWIKNGVRLGWLVDPQTQTTTIFRPSQPAEIKPFTELLSGEDVLVGFTMNVAEVLSY